MTARPPASDAEPTADQYRETMLRQVRELTEDNQRLFQSVMRSEKRYRTLAKAVWHVQEEERRRLARELHDGLGQTLTALANQIQRIADDARAHANLGLEHRLSDALDLTRGALHDTRELSRLLRPTLLDDLGLDAALGWLARTLGERTGLAIEFHSGLEERRLPPDVETLVFRITQEALTNIIRHSGAGEAQIVLTLGDGVLRLHVRDEGSGFDPAELNSPDKLGASAGVRGMRDRAELFGGRIEIGSVPGEGTSVQLILPLELNQDSAPLRASGAA